MIIIIIFLCTLNLIIILNDHMFGPESWLHLNKREDIQKNQCCRTKTDSNEHSATQMLSLYKIEMQIINIYLVSCCWLSHLDSYCLNRSLAIKIQITIQKAAVRYQFTRMKSQTWIRPGWLSQRHLTVQPQDSPLWFHIHQQQLLLCKTTLSRLQEARAKRRPLCLIKCRSRGKIVNQPLSRPPSSLLEENTRRKSQSSFTDKKTC